MKIDSAEHATGKAIEVTIEIQVAILDADIGLDEADVNAAIDACPVIRGNIGEVIGGLCR